MFTPRNIKMNWAFDNILFIVTPVIMGNQCVNPAMIANTAPIDKT